MTLISRHMGTPCLELSEKNVMDDTLQLWEQPIVTRLKLFVAAKLCVSGYILLVDHESTMTMKLGTSP